MSISIRQVERGDANAIAAVHASAWLAGYRGLVSDEFLETISVEERAARWASLLGEPDLPPVMVAVREGVVVGFCATATPTRDPDTHGDVAEIAVLNVSANAWRSGVGTALMKDALAWLRQDGWSAVTLWVADRNKRAQEFYKTFGFEFDGSSDIHKGSGMRTVRMRLTLAGAS